MSTLELLMDSNAPAQVVPSSLYKTNPEPAKTTNKGPAGITTETFKLYEEREGNKFVRLCVW